MLVKHNLFTKTPTEFVSDVWRASADYKRWSEDNIIFFSTASDDTTSLNGVGLSINTKENENYIIEAENLCDQEILISTDNKYKQMIINPYEKRHFSFNSEHVKYLSISPIKLNTTATYKLRINSIMVTNEVVNIYLPHKDNLSTEKQPLLPPEGDYKEIQAR